MVPQSHDRTEAPTYRLLLFVAGDEKKSVVARENLQRFCEVHLSDCSHVEVVDVTKDYRKALEYRVMITPALLVLTPPPTIRIAGTLDDVNRVRAALCLPEPRQ